MSRLYGTARGDSARTEATRRGHSTLTTHAASWHGAVRVELTADATLHKNGARYVVDLVPWHDSDFRRPICTGLFGDSRGPSFSLGVDIDAELAQAFDMLARGYGGKCADAIQRARRMVQRVSF